MGLGRASVIGARCQGDGVLANHVRLEVAYTAPLLPCAEPLA